MDKAPFTVEQYRQAFSQLTLSQKQIELLLAHYLMPERTATAKLLANAIGWAAYQAANAQYGGLAKKLIIKIGAQWPADRVHMYAISKIWHDQEWHWQMWPEVSGALEVAGLIEPKWLGGMENHAGPTDRESLIKQRVAQGRFRLSLLQAWHRTCSATGASDASMLIASHIKPWRACDDAERLDPFNGLLLSPNLDRAFDKGYISFADDGSILIQSGREGALRNFGIHADIRLRQLHDRHRHYLVQHRRIHGYED